MLLWLLRRGGLYLLLVLAVALAPRVADALRGESFRDVLMSPREVSDAFGRLQRDAAEASRASRAKISEETVEALGERRRRAGAELTQVDRDLGEKRGWFDSVRPQTILKRKKLELRRAALKGEIGLIEAALDRHALRERSASIMAPTKGAIEAAGRGCDAAKAEVRRFRERYELEQSLRNVLTDEEGRLDREAQNRCEAHRALIERRAKAVERWRTMQAELGRAEQAFVKADVDAGTAISSIRLSQSGTLRTILIKAAILLAGIIATPYLIRLVFYFILAPLAARRPAVRLRWPADALRGSPTIAGPSATSAPMTLAAGEELLVRQGFLQSTSSAGAKSTQALLAWRHPLSSLASGLAFLTRITGEGETTTVSAVHDPFAEVAVLNLPAGAACVLQPRALVAAAQPAGRPLRITSHWRLGSLHAWLTLQLRYLMFHGPARLVIKGGRGVRVEQVERGRVFGQDQLVGFSADLAYSVTRTETFWPYFLGMEQLLKDKVEAGEGVLIVEEAPTAAGGRARSRRGLEGAADVLLKAVGL